MAYLRFMITMKTKQGRKTVADKAERVVLYIKASTIKKHGGQEGIKTFLLNKIKNKN